MQCRTKRKRVVVTMQQKLEALKRINRGEPLWKVAEYYNVGYVTVSDWKRKRLEIENWCKTRISASGDRRTMKKSDYEKVSEELFQWYTQQRESNIRVTGPILQNKALKLNQQFGDSKKNFSASTGWLDRWKKRYGVQTLNESLDLHPITATNILEYLQYPNTQEELSLNQIYNCDETVLNYKQVPFEIPGLDVSTSTTPSERATLLACCNASGAHKLKLALLDKDLSSISCDSPLPVWHDSGKIPVSSKTDIFQNWFFSEFIPSVEEYLQSKNLPRKAILFIKTNSIHCTQVELYSNEIKTFYLPECENIGQPILSVLELITKNYWKMVKHCILDVKLEFFSTLNINDILMWIAKSWEQVDGSAIANTWGGCVRNDRMIEEVNLIFQEEANIKKEELAETDPVEAEISPIELINHYDGHKALKTALEYIEQNGSTETDVLLFRKWCYFAENKIMESEKS